MKPGTNGVRDRVCAVVAHTFDLDRDSISAELGMEQIDAWDSLSHLTLMMEIEKEFSLRLSTDQIARPKTVGQICELLEQLLGNE